MASDGGLPLRVMKISTTRFVKSAPDLDACPDWEMPEFALIGRSNTGKSSLLNVLTGQKALAKVSATPGATRLINFYEIDARWALVDLPGYGYSKTSQKVRDEFQSAVSGYLSGRTNLRVVFVLIDSRLTPQAIDLEFCGWLADGGIRFALVFTKTDKLKPAAVNRNVQTFLTALEDFCNGEPRVFLTSANVPKPVSGRGQMLDYVGEVMAGG